MIQEYQIRVLPEQAASEQADRIIDEAKQKVKQIELDALEQIQAYESEQLKLSEERRQKAIAEAEKDARAFVEVLKGKADAKFSETVGTVKSIIVG